MPQCVKPTQTEPERSQPQESDPAVRDRQRQHGGNGARHREDADAGELSRDDRSRAQGSICEEGGQQQNVVDIRRRE
jgi:hypothetical protein